MLCNSIFDKNYKLYLKHEQMQDAERDKRIKLVEDYQSRM